VALAAPVTPAKVFYRNAVFPGCLMAPVRERVPGL